MNGWSYGSTNFLKSVAEVDLQDGVQHQGGRWLWLGGRLFYSSTDIIYKQYNHQSSLIECFHNLNIRKIIFKINKIVQKSTNPVQLPLQVPRQEFLEHCEVRIDYCIQRERVRDVKRKTLKEENIGSYRH